MCIIETKCTNILKKNNFGSDDSKIISTNDEIIKLDYPVMARFQNTLKEHLSKQKYIIKQELIKLVCLFN